MPSLGFSLPLSFPAISRPPPHVSKSFRTPLRPPLPRTRTLVSSAAASASTSPSPSPARPREAGLRTVPETLSPLPCTVTGTIPPWLRGTLTRVGPSVFEAPAADGSLVKFRHWFDGLPYIHRFDIRSGTDVVYDSRHVARHVERQIALAPRAADVSAVLIGGRGRKEPLLKRLAMLVNLAKGAFGPKGELPGETPYPIGVVVERGTIGGEGLALTTDAASVMLLDEVTMEPVKVLRYGDMGLKVGQLACAHGEFDGGENAFYNVAYSPSAKTGDLKVVRIDGETGAGTVFATVRNVPSSYFHSFALTEKYIVICVPSSRVDGLAIIANLSFLDGLTFDAGADMLLYVIDRASGEHVSTFTTSPGFFFHIANCYDELSGDGGANVVIDICRYDSVSGVDSFSDLTVEKLAAADYENFATLTRFTLARVDRNDSGRVDEVALSRVSLELPRINEAYRRKQHRYAYGITGGGEEGRLFSSLAKVDCLSRSDTVFEAPEEGIFYSEPIFVAKPGPLNAAASEDDGVVVTVELDARSTRPKSALLILDAVSFTEVARCEVDAVIPFSFHGNFLLR